MAMIANRASEAAAVKRVLNGGGGILVVGGRSSNFDPHLRSHPRVTFWDSTDPKTAQATPPDNTRVVVCTRFVRHSMFAKIQRYCSKRHLLMLPGLNSTGEIKDVIQMALNLAPPSADTAGPPSPPVPGLSPEEFHRAIGTTQVGEAVEPKRSPYSKAPSPARVFLAARLDHSATPAAEFARLKPLLEAEGIEQTEAGLKQMIYILRREHAGLPSTVRAKKAPATAAAAPSPVPESNIVDALRLLDDLTVGIGLVREAVLKVQQDDERTQATMSALRGFLNNGGGAFLQGAAR